MHQGIEKIGEVISRLFTERGWGRRQALLRVERAWEESIGAQDATHARVQGIKRGVLEVMVDNAVLLQELASFRKRKLLEEMRKRLPETTITDLRFRAGQWDN